MHERIRNDLNPNGRKIREWDKLFENNPDGDYRKYAAAYARDVLNAQRYELENAQIILCTCTTAGSPKMSMLTKHLDQMVLSLSPCRSLLDCRPVSETVQECMTLNAIYKNPTPFPPKNVGWPAQSTQLVSERRHAICGNLCRKLWTTFQRLGYCTG